MSERTGRFFRQLSKGENPFQGEAEHETFWALKDVSFNVEHGEVLGIIGRNGAGKSTLLKLLSRITEPDKGRIVLNGRVASLLEVGTGFHPELTGRENIYLSGAILGMRREEIKKRFDEIVDFAGVEKFLDTPVKRYSSGMYVRLGFAVAAHLETEILLVDEVLSVGDVEFKMKCLNKMSDVTNNGKTIFFVSHDLEAIKRLCKVSLWLQNGKIKEIGYTENIIENYELAVKNISSIDTWKRSDRSTSGKFIIQNVETINEHGVKVRKIKFGKAVEFRIYFKLYDEKIDDFRVDIRLNQLNGVRLSWFSSFIKYDKPITLVRGKNNFFSLKINSLPLIAGFYSLTIYATSNNSVLDYVEDAHNFEVLESDYYAKGKLVPHGQGVFLVDYEILFH